MPRKVTTGFREANCLKCGTFGAVYMQSGWCRECNTRLRAPYNRERRERLRPKVRPCPDCGNDIPFVLRMTRCESCRGKAHAVSTAKTSNSRRVRSASDPDLEKRYARSSTARRYGLTVEEYDALVAPGVCDICRGPSVKPDGRFKRPSIDHCHVTGKVRGVLCHNCNILIGHAKENVAILRSAVEYLERHKISSM